MEGTLKSIVGMICITLLASIALFLGYDGLLYLTTVGILAGVCGYPILTELRDYYDFKSARVTFRQRK